MKAYDSLQRTKAFSAAVALAILTVEAPSASSAGPREQTLYIPPSRIVSFTDLNLSRPADVDTLYRRIRTAARSVCQQAISSTDPEALTHYEECYTATFDQAVAHVNHTLAALHRETLTTKPMGLSASANK